MRALRGLTLLVLAWGLLATMGTTAMAAAHRRPALKQIGPAYGLVGDGERFVAYQPVPETLTIVDTEQHTSRSVPLDTHCHGLSDALAGVLLYQSGCASGQPQRSELMDLATAEPLQFPESPALGSLDPPVSENPVSWGSLGRYWILGSQCGYKWCRSLYLNRTTGQLIVDPPFDPPFTSYPIRDLDKPDAPWLVSPLVTVHHKLYLRAGGKLRYLDPCRPNCRTTLLRDDVVVGLDDVGNPPAYDHQVRVFVYQVRQRRLLRWRLADLAGHRPGDRIIRVAVTKTRIYVQAGNPDTFDRTSVANVYEGPLSSGR